MILMTENNLGVHADDVYAYLLEAVQDMSAEQASRFNARLVLILMNHVGDSSTIRDAIRLANTGMNKE